MQNQDTKRLEGSSSQIVYKKRKLGLQIPASDILLVMEIQKTIVTVLSPFPFVRKIILFGSRARRDNQPKSDYDIAIDCPQATRDQWIEVIQAIENIPTLYAIQLVRLDTSSMELQQEIAKDGIILYER